jgi:glyceraldehyde-3-phosphate dehydrogenase (ferredoxin)
MNEEYKKDYEPYQTMGPLSGIFDQRAAEKLNHKADALGFDAISVGGFISWVMDCVDKGFLTKEEAGISTIPKFTCENFDLVKDSEHNADIGIEILNAIIGRKGEMNLTEGWRKLARRLARSKGKKVMDNTLYSAYARRGWMVPNQYWTPGVLSPMSIMGKYYMYYGKDFVPPRELGRKNAKRMMGEFILDNTGICRFHRGWAEEMVPEILEELYGLKEEFNTSLKRTASRINSRNSSVFWESELAIDYVYTFMRRRKEVEGDQSDELSRWIEKFDEDKNEASLEFWYEIHKGIHESLREFT